MCLSCSCKLQRSNMRMENKNWICWTSILKIQFLIFFRKLPLMHQNTKRIWRPTTTCTPPTGLDRRGKNKYAETALLKFNFYLGQQVALLCADRTTGNWKLNSWNLKWKFILKISENEYSHQWCQFQFSIFTKIEWPQYTLTSLPDYFPARWKVVWARD